MTVSRSHPVRLQGAVDLLRGLADPTRVRVLNLLADGELCVCDLVALLGQPQPLVSRHLAYLRRVGWVEARRVGRFAHYRLSRSRGAVHRRLLAMVRRDLAADPALAGERAEGAARRALRRTAPCPSD